MSDTKIGIYRPPVRTIGDIFESVEGGGGEAWQHELVIDTRGTPEATIGNVILALEKSPLMRGVLALDIFRQQMIVSRAPPWVARSPFPRELVDADIVRAAEWLARAYSIKARIEIVKHALIAVTEDNQIDPVPTWLRSLKWDGVPRIGCWLSTYMQAEPTALNAEIGRRWLISAVARACKPGCKVDHVLVLEGAQGARKSSGLRALVGDEWFTDGLEDVSGREPAMQLAGKWVIEIAELNAIRGKALTAVKRFVTIQSDRYRAPYGLQSRDWPRRCVFAATTNEAQYLQDIENRRYWPVKVGHVDTVGIERDRSQVWAEALVAFVAGERWWIEDDGIHAALRVAHDERHESDPWESAIEREIDGLSHTTVVEILDRLRLPQERRTRGDMIRVGHVLRRLGWERIRYRAGNLREWRYVPPGTSKDAQEAYA